MLGVEKLALLLYRPRQYASVLKTEMTLEERATEYAVTQEDYCMNAM